MRLGWAAGPAETGRSLWRRAFRVSGSSQGQDFCPSGTRHAQHLVRPSESAGSRPPLLYSPPSHQRAPDRPVCSLPGTLLRGGPTPPRLKHHTKDSSEREDDDRTSSCIWFPPSFWTASGSCGETGEEPQEARAARGSRGSSGSSTARAEITESQRPWAGRCQGDHRSDHWLPLCSPVPAPKGGRNTPPRPAGAHGLHRKGTGWTPSEKTTSWVTYIAPLMLRSFSK